MTAPPNEWIIEMSVAIVRRHKDRFRWVMSRAIHDELSRRGEPGDVARRTGGVVRLLLPNDMMCGLPVRVGDVDALMLEMVR